MEDEAIIAMDIKASLEEAGATVAGSAQTLPQALEFAKHLDMAAAILDVRLGSRSISPVAEILRGRAVPFLFYSGQTTGDAVLHEWPGVPLLSKPALPRELAEAVARLVNR
ncbi:MAG TPA: hypothetical protein VHU23_19655 [Rhizomicrobium sp.]|nr:hypothetical protein [Rhizomicrobium sp.]